MRCHVSGEICYLGAMRSLFVLTMALLLGCPSPDSVEIGGACKDQVECKDPADKCVTAIGRQLCTTHCTAERVCPENFVCARMDVTVTESGPGGVKWTGEAGYCLPADEVPPRAAKIRPRKKKARRNGKNK